MTDMKDRCRFLGERSGIARRTLTVGLLLGTLAASAKTVHNRENRPIPSLEFPGYDSVVSKELPSPPDLPPFVAIPKATQGAGSLGVEFAPFNMTATPRAGRPFTVRGLTLGRGLTVEKIEKRHRLRSDLDAAFRAYEADSALVKGLDRFAQRAHDILSLPRSILAFDTSLEPPSIAGLFPDEPFAKSCLLKQRAGRDHYPRAMFVLLAGGGMRGGLVIGASDDKAAGPASGDGVSPDDVATSFYHSLGIDARKEYRTPSGRPVAIDRDGTIVKELFT